MNWIAVTLAGVKPERKILVNIANAIAIDRSPQTKYTVIKFSKDDSIPVRETPDELVELVTRATAKQKPQ